MTRELSTGAAATMLLLVVALFAAGFLAGAFYTQERQAERIGSRGFTFNSAFDFKVLKRTTICN